MRLTRSVRMAVAAVATVGLLGLSGCSDDAEEPKAENNSAAEESPSADEADEAAESEEPEESDESDEAESMSEGGQPDWALPVVTDGELISTIEAGDVTVEVYQVGTATATKDGQFADPKTNKPLLAKGDEIVFVNYVVTNNGDPIDLGASLVSISARYDDWEWMQGMDAVVDDALFEEKGLNDDPKAPGSYRDPSVYTLGSGQQYSFAENFKYQKNSPITFDVSITPVDAEGELLHDDRIEAEGTGTIA